MIYNIHVCHDYIHCGIASLKFHCLYYCDIIVDVCF